MTESNQNKIGRRNLIVAAVTGAVAAPLISSLMASQAFAADAKKAAKGAAAPAAKDDIKMAKTEGPNANPVAKALGYIEKSKTPGKSCSNCQLFTADTAKKDGKAIGKCTMITGVSVYADAYCNSWAKKS